MTDKKMRGFTLIELMIVVVIISIVLTVAIPSYQNNMRESRRTDGHNALQSLANLQERYYLQNNTYAPDIGTLNPPSLTSQEGYYDLTVVGNASTFTATATAVPGGPQANDAPCTVMTLNQAQQKLPSVPVNCW